MPTASPVSMCMPARQQATSWPTRPKKPRWRRLGVPGTTTDLAHLIPLVIQDKTFVNDATVTLVSHGPDSIHCGDRSLWVIPRLLGRRTPPAAAISGSPMSTSRTRTRPASPERTLWADGITAPGSGRSSRLHRPIRRRCPLCLKPSWTRPWSMAPPIPTLMCWPHPIGCGS